LRQNSKFYSEWDKRGISIGEWDKNGEHRVTPAEAAAYLAILEDEGNPV
jgi:hypothetical protein